MASLLTAHTMLKVVEEIELFGRTELFAYLIAFKAAGDVMGPQWKRPIGKCSNVEYNTRLLGICFAAHYLNDFPTERTNHAA